ncbi:extracellular solute-binding protein [Paenibacillus contaminans]|uniref:ABC transporter substrate-binding protein n=1 Tax=Paenibacillus contaminans TaxID=450362 RepID=A0A329LXD7_9BACL|nr:extracellular solute-binding protein [Paenibacillus contaminans]RAV11872.1 hypothetical protein DQG23_35405 [Paenibacillus contaminans]
MITKLWNGMRRSGLMALVAVTAAAAALSGCMSDGSSSNGGGTKEDGKGNVPSISPSELGLEPVEGKYDPPLELSMVNFMYGAPKFSEGEDMNDNRWVNYIREQYGIILRTLWEAPTDQLEQKVNMMIASGDIPDIVLVTPTQLVQLTKAGMIEDLTDVYERHAPRSVKDVVESAGQEVLESATINGRLMGLPFTGTEKENVPVLWIREDWMKRLNMPEPKTMNDLFAISEAFSTMDPDGNGKQDTFGLPLDKNLYMLTAIFNGYHAYRGNWIKDRDGKLVYGSVQPEVKQVLAKLQELYKAGQIDKEFGVKDMLKIEESVGRNQLGIYFGTMTGGYALSHFTPGVKWLPYPVPSSDGKLPLLQHPLNITYGYWVVKKGVTHPEAIYKLADLWLKLFYENKNDEVYDKFNTDTKVGYWTAAPIKLYKPFKNMEISLHLEPLLKSGKRADAGQLGKLTPEERQVYDMIQAYKAGDQKLWFYASRNDIGGSGEIISNYVNNNQFMPDQFNGTMTPTMVQKGAILNKMETEMMTKVIMGAPLSLFDEFAADWSKLGGEQMTKEVNDWYARK